MRNVNREPASTVRIVLYGAMALSAVILAGIGTVMFLARGTGEDITGVVAPAVLALFLAVVVAIIAGVQLQRRRKTHQ